MTEPRWIDRRALVLLHAEGLAEHGGPEGVRDAGLLESALDRPRTLAACEPESDLARLAACYAVGMARNHPFVDGNKRVGLATAEVFLLANGHSLEATDDELVELTLGIACGTTGKEAVAEFYRERVRGG